MFKNKLSQLISIQDNGQNYTEEEHTLKLHFTMSRIYLIVVVITLSMLAIVHYFADNKLYSLTNSIGVIVACLAIVALEKITPKQFYTLAHTLFIIFIILILITFAYDTQVFPLTTWYLVYIMGVFFIFNHKTVLKYSLVFFIIFLYIVFNDITLTPSVQIGNFIFTASLGYMFIYFYEYRANLLQDRLIHINEFLEDRIKEETEARTQILHQEKERLDFLAKHDYLTQIPNMFSLHEVLDERCQNTDNRFALLYIDLNKFKNINDVYGHSVGNETLIILTKRLKKIPSSHIITRVGGDEFIIIIDNAKTEKDIKKEIENYIMEIEKEIVIKNIRLNITASIGISIFPDDHVKKEYLIKFADRAMKKSKEYLISKYTFYAHENSILGYSKLQLEFDLYNALSNEEFILYYQPQYHTKQQTITCIEALLRWNHPKLGILVPKHFLDLAKEIGILKDIETYVIHTAFKSISKWQKKHNYKGRISINLSIQKLESKYFLQETKDALKQYECKGEWIEFEILETEIISDIPTIQSIFKKLHEKNIHIAIDDFGTGYASLSYLLLLNIDKIKIDKIFIDNLAYSSNTLSIIKAIVTIAKSFNYELVIEGVETEKQLDILNELSCYNIQGYYFYRPMPEENILSLFHSDALVASSS